MRINNKVAALTISIFGAISSISAHAESVFDNLQDPEIIKALVCTREKIGMCEVDKTISDLVADGVKTISFQEYVDLQVGRGYKIIDVEYTGTIAILYFTR